MSSPGQGPMTLEDRVTKLEVDTAKNNENITTGIQKLIDILNQMRLIECELPPGCVQPTTTEKK
jgi:hypothetical protein